MIFGSTVGYDSIYSYPYESRKITVQEMMENIHRKRQRREPSRRVLKKGI